MSNGRIIITALTAIVGWSGLILSNTSAGQVGDFSNSWTEVAGLPAARRDLAAGVLSNYLYAFGGYDGSVLSNMYRYNGTNWTQVAGLPAAREYLGGGVLDGYLYAVGGNNGGYKTNVYRYNGTSWSEVTGLSTGYDRMAVGILNNYLYSVGGNNGSARTNVYRYDGTSWSEVAGLPAARYGMAAGILNDYLYAVGGTDGTTRTNVYRYDGTNWAEVAGLPAARYVLAADVLDGYLYAIAGGNSSGQGTTNVYRYDGSSWSEMASLPNARFALAAGVLNDHLYAVGGSDTQTNVYRLDWVQIGSGISLSNGPVSGGTLVTIGGLNLGNGSDITNVTLCGVSASIQGQSTTQVVVRTGNTALPVRGHVIVWSTSKGLTTGSNLFTYFNINPTNGPLAGGNTVTISNGYDLGNGSDITNVLLCGVSASIQTQGSNWVRVTAGGALSRGTGNIVIQSPTVGATELFNGYKYNPAGQVGDFSNSWTEVAGRPAARRDLAAGVLSNYLYAFGGYDGSVLSNMYRYNGTNWTQV
ncbi:MAG: IPT/TIG domain-containing protein, partial [Kiritimatiellota bacterium]|nr:IPT/TIG domain-containing protein [Kiritimatiellota bacterium]